MKLSALCRNCIVQDLLMKDLQCKTCYAGSAYARPAMQILHVQVLQ